MQSYLGGRFNRQKGQKWRSRPDPECLPCDGERRRRPILQAYYFGSPVPDLLPRQLWLLLHCVGGMLFGGLVFSSTLYEALVILQGDPQVRRWWFERVSCLPHFWVGLFWTSSLFPSAMGPPKTRNKKDMCDKKTTLCFKNMGTILAWDILDRLPFSIIDCGQSRAKREYLENNALPPSLVATPPAQQPLPVFPGQDGPPICLIFSFFIPRNFLFFPKLLII